MILDFGQEGLGRQQDQLLLQQTGKSSFPGNGGLGVGCSGPKGVSIHDNPLPCRTGCMNPCTYSTVYATTSSLPPPPSSSSSTRRTFLRKRSRKSISASASRSTMVSPELPGLTPPPRDPPNQGLRSCVVPAQTWQLGFGICCDGAGEGEMRMMRIGSILKKGWGRG